MSEADAPRSDRGTTAWLSLGSNLGDRAATLTEAVRRLGATPGVATEAVSGFYETPPWGELDQGPFLNAAVTLRTSLAPHALLDAAQRIEQALGRAPTRRWGPRVIDIDIVHLGGTAMSDERLTLPHPRWRERAFVLVPLAEIAPELLIGGIRVSQALADRPRAEIDAISRV